MANSRPPEDVDPARWPERWWMVALVSARGRPLGLVLLIVLAALMLGPETRPIRALRLASFDLLQSRLPRTRISEPVIIVAIDEASLKRYGQWPWPRTVLAKLVTAIGAAGPAAIALDILMPEPDRLSPGRLLTLIPGVDPDVVARLQRMPGNDAVLAEALRGRAVVVGVAGLDAAAPTATTSGLRTAPVRVFGVDDPRPLGRRFPAALRSVDEIDVAAPGHALVGLELDDSVVRRIALVASVGPTIMPTLGLEMLRLVSEESTLTIHADRRGIRAVGVGDLVVPTQPDGSVFVHFARHDPARFVSAADVLDGTVAARVLERKLVLIGVTAHGLADQQVTPMGDAMSGAEIHAQFLEGLFDDALLSRPSWAVWLEAAALVVGGLLLLWLVPALPVKGSVALLLVLVAIPIALGLFSYAKLNVLHDTVTPAAGLGLVFTAVLGVALADTQSQRRALRRQLAREREAAARIAVELEAARRIQMGSLPDPASAFPGEKRFTLWAHLEPAREVGGDLYDFFRLDENRICLLIGDVSGKGLPSSLFMAMSKALFKGIALGRTGDVGSVMRDADREISRDNGEGLFVTAWVGVLNVQTGYLEYCNAGHDPPYVLLRHGRAVERLAEGGGPPLCVVDDFSYEVASHQLSPGETLCLVTDGVTEATDASGAFYGRGRLEAVLAGLSPDGGVAETGDAVRDDVARFAAGVEPADDIAILVLQWNGA